MMRGWMSLRSTHPTRCNICGMKHVCVMLGNGFTLDFAHHHALKADIELTRLMPPPPGAVYSPPDDTDEWTGCPLSDETLFPELWKLSRSISSGSIYPLCQLLGKSSPHLNRPGQQFFPGQAGVELRFYLWHLFRHYDRTFRSSNQRSMLRTWPWYATLQYMCLSWCVTIVSFNYDLVCEHV